MEKALQDVQLEDGFKMKISFDFDGVLDTEKGQEFFKSLIHANFLADPMGAPFNLVIVTTRHEDRNNEEILRTAANLGMEVSKLIPKIIFTNGQWKWETIEKLGIDLHIDDNLDEVHLINEKCSSAQAVLFGANVHKILLEGTEL